MKPASLSASLVAPVSSCPCPVARVDWAFAERLPASPLLMRVSEGLPASPLLSGVSEAVFCNSLLTPVLAVLWQGGAGGAGYAEDANPAERVVLAYAASAELLKRQVRKGSSYIAS